MGPPTSTPDLVARRLGVTTDTRTSTETTTAPRAQSTRRGERKAFGQPAIGTISPPHVSSMYCCVSSEVSSS